MKGKEKPRQMCMEELSHHVHGDGPSVLALLSCELQSRCDLHLTTSWPGRIRHLRCLGGGGQVRLGLAKNLLSNNEDKIPRIPLWLGRGDRKSSVTGEGGGSAMPGMITRVKPGSQKRRFQLSLLLSYADAP